MLALAVAEGDYILVGDSVRIFAHRHPRKRNMVQVGIDAPRDINISLRRKRLEVTEPESSPDTSDAGP